MNRATPAEVETAQAPRDQDAADAIRARVERLREEFDGTFRAAIRAAGAPPLRFLGLRAGGEPYALRMADVAGLHADRKVAPVPTASPTLLGVASFRGAIVAVHDLHAFLGRGTGTGGARRWWVLVRPERPVGLAFEQLDGHFESDPRSPLDSEGGGRGYTRGATLTGDLIRPVVDVASILRAIAGANDGNNPPVDRGER